MRSQLFWCIGMLILLLSACGGKPYSATDTLPQWEIGDSRMVGVHQYADTDPDKDLFIAQIGEGLGWFQTEAVPRLKELLDQGGESIVLINMGFNDCYATCQIGTDTRARQYSGIINDLREAYPGVTFYFCSVGPAAAENYDGIPDVETLNREVDRFNQEMMAQCQAAYIDCGENLLRSGFETWDGIHYNIPTTRAWHAYVMEQIEP